MSTYSYYYTSFVIPSSLLVGHCQWNLNARIDWLWGDTTTKTNGYKAHTCFNFPPLQNASILCVSSFLFPNYTIELMHVYATLFCVCIWAQDIEIQNTPNENDENESKNGWRAPEEKKMRKPYKTRTEQNRTEKKTWPLTSIDSNFQTHTYSICVLVDYKTFLVKTCLHPHVELDLFRHNFPYHSASASALFHIHSTIWCGAIKKLLSFFYREAMRIFSTTHAPSTDIK